MRNRIVFGDASYIKDGVVKARRLKRGDGWKQAYVAIITGLDDVHGLRRNFIKMKGEVTKGGTPLLVWELPTDFSGVIEFGWASDNVKQSEPSTHYILCEKCNYFEITESQCYREFRNGN